MPTSDCGICGQPPGECYNLCPNSPNYYSPEQERYDDQFYGEDDNRERYAAEIRDLELEGEADAAYWTEQDELKALNASEPGSEIPAELVWQGYNTTNGDDIPF
jgi:hypothetical protein